MLKFALFGCGRIAQRYGALLQGEVNGANLVAACDPDESVAAAFSKKFNIPVYGSLNELIVKHAVDVVCVLTPSGLHAQNVLEVASHKIHVVVEKPMALSVADADKMIAACEKSDVKLFVVKQNRYNLPIVKLREVFEKGAFGKLVMGTIRVRWCRTQEYYDQAAWRGTAALDGGVLTNQASHHIDLLEWFMGPVKTVVAKGKNFLSNIETQDTAIAMLEFQNGAFGVIEATTAARPRDVEGSLSILGERGLVEIGGFAVNKVREWQFTDKNFDAVTKDFSENPPDVYGFGHQRYLTRVVECVVKNQKPDVDGHDGRKAVRLLEALNQSLATGREIVVA